MKPFTSVLPDVTSSQAWPRLTALTQRVYSLYQVPFLGFTVKDRKIIQGNLSVKLILTSAATQYPQAFQTIARFDHLISEIHNSREAFGKQAAYY